MSEAADGTMIGKTVGGRYVIERLLGQGGMGAVYEAVEADTSHRVALKVLHAELAARDQEHLDRFFQETLAAALVNHPNVVKSLGAFADGDGRPVLVLELLKGISLDRVIRGGPMRIGRAVDIAMQTAEGICAAHAKGIVHRDLKPANVFLVDPSPPDRNPRVKVLDFGVARLRDPQRSKSALRGTADGVLLGTLEYMSPEQLQNASGADERSDVYALGVILYEMLMGWVPFRAETDPMLVVQILSAPAPALAKHRADVPAQLAEIVQRAIAKKPEARWRSMRDFAQALQPFIGLDSSPSRVTPPPGPVEMLITSKSDSRKLVANVVFIVLLAIVAIVFALLR